MPSSIPGRASQQHPEAPQLAARQVLVTVGTLCGISAIGTSETQRALATRNKSLIGFAARDAGLVGIDTARSTADSPVFVGLSGERHGRRLDIEEIEASFGDRLRANMGIRDITHLPLAAHVPIDIGAPLPHDLESGGLRKLLGFTFAEVRRSRFADMFGLFEDDPRLGPSLQAELFLYGGLGALAALPAPLSGLLPAHRFRIAAGCAFPGLDSLDRLAASMQPKRGDGTDKAVVDRLAYRLSSSLNTHGPALLSTLLSPGYSLSRVKRRPELLETLAGPDGLRGVPQAPLVISGACASALLSLCEIAERVVGVCPGAHGPELVMLTAADAALRPDGRVLEGFGSSGALVSRASLEAFNQGRPSEQRRTMRDCLCPFDMDAQGTAIGHGGSGVLVTTLEFALRHQLDITGIVAGWGQSGETGGKGHFAGVGFGGENALLMALSMAQLAHGYGVQDFTHLVAHATGTRTNSRTDLACVSAARQAARLHQGYAGRLPEMTISAPKALGDAHTMGETGLKALGEAIQYVLGQPCVGIPTLRQLDDALGPLAQDYRFSADPVAGNEASGALVVAQGFGGYDAAVALRGATPESLRRYACDARVLDAYLERWPELRAERREREARCWRTPGFALQLAEEHGWRAPFDAHGSESPASVR
jgi:3-oxoacyl-(acyl-carrier-protein) synthase